MVLQGCKEATTNADPCGKSSWLQQNRIEWELTKRSKLRGRIQTIPWNSQNLTCQSMSISNCKKLIVVETPIPPVGLPTCIKLSFLQLTSPQKQTCEHTKPTKVSWTISTLQTANLSETEKSQYPSCHCGSPLQGGQGLPTCHPVPKRKQR